MASASHIKMLLSLNDDYVWTADRLERSGSPYSEIIDIIQAIADGEIRGKLTYYVDRADGTAASQTIVWDGSDGVDGDTVTVCGVVLTAKTTASLDPKSGEFALSSNDTTQATNFLTAINRHPLLKHIVIATNVTLTTTLTMVEKGVLGNLGTISTSNAELATLGAAVFAGGAAGTVTKNLTVDDTCCNIV